MPGKAREEGVVVSEEGQRWEMSHSGGRDGEAQVEIRKEPSKPSVTLLGKRVRKTGKAV